MPRLFVAVWPPDDVLDHVARLDRPAVKGLQWTGREQWHVTLRFLGNVPEVDAVVDALSGVRATPVASAALGPATARFDQRVLYVPVAGIDDLAAEVIAATARLGRPLEDRPFSGHLTLARVSRGMKVDLRPLTGTPLGATWTVEEVCVVESHLSSSGARYEVRQRVRLDPYALRSTRSAPTAAPHGRDSTNTFPR